MSDKISFILYEKTNLPRYYEINKKILQLAFYGFPAIALICLATTIGMGTFIKTQDHLKKNKTTTISPLQIQNQTLIEKNNELQQLNQQLQNKLASAQASSSPSNESNEKWIAGNSSNKKLSGTFLSIENPKTFIKNNNIHFNFNLSNQLKNKVRLKGFIHVIMKKGNQLFFWPAPSLPPKKLIAPYNSGEAFSTRYFRPVLAKFPIPSMSDKKNQEYHFFVSVYNTAGDIIHQENITQAARKKEQGP